MNITIRMAAADMDSNFHDDLSYLLQRVFLQADIQVTLSGLDTYTIQDLQGTLADLQEDGATVTIK